VQGESEKDFKWFGGLVHLTKDWGVVKGKK